MADTTQLIRLVVEQQNPDNNIRKAAELAFSEYVRQNSSTAAFELIMAATVPEDQLPVEVRQACLLHLKRLVPKYWSMGFQLFIGPPIDQDLKAMIRQNLIMLATSSSNSKIRKSSSYVIVQIAAVDYPDEWPDLLSRLYQQALKYDDEIAVLGSLIVLTDLFDDLITEEMFWEEGLGNEFLSYITNLLVQPQLGLGVKVNALNLYLTVFSTLLSSEATQSETRMEAVHSHIRQFTSLLLPLIQNSIATCNSSLSVLLIELDLRSNIYTVLAKIVNEFLRLVLEEVLTALANTVIEDFVNLNKAFKSVLINQDCDVPTVKSDSASDPDFLIASLLSKLLEFLSILQERTPLCKSVSPDVFPVFISSLVNYAELPAQTLENYSSDFNNFVSDSTGLSRKVSVREAIQDFLSDSHPNDVVQIFHIVNGLDSSSDWKLKEACLFIIEGIFSNSKVVSLGPDFSVPAYLSQMSSLSSNSSESPNHPLVVSRAFLLVPKLMDQFHSQLSVSSFASVEIKKMLEHLGSAGTYETEELHLLISSALISVTLWKNVEGLSFSSLDSSIQDLIFESCSRLAEDSDEDTLPVLIEAISAAIEISNEKAQTVSIRGSGLSTIELILNISFKDPSNIQLIVDATECLEAFLTDISMENYLRVCDKSIPYLMQEVSASMDKLSIEYSPELSLRLEMLCIIITQFPLEPSEQQLPQQLFTCVFPGTSKLILNTRDDEILQRAGELFNAIIQKAPDLVVLFQDPVTGGSGTELLLAIASKFLSPELSDSAAMNCGLTVISLFENFQKYLDNDFFYQLLQATVRRLLIAKSVVTIENLIMVFCKLVLNTSAELVIQALISMEIADNDNVTRNGLELVIPIWLDNFEVARGFEKIKQNVLALGKIFSLGDSRLAQLVVNGDLIPYDGDLIITRSMAKSMPEKYTQIPAPQKIISLLAGELDFQCQQPDPNDFLPEDANEAGGSDWEDMDDIGVPNFEKLKSYVDSDDEDAAMSQDQDIKEILIQFFKECLSKNLGNFRDYYEALDDTDKTVITENVIFT